MVDDNSSKVCNLAVWINSKIQQRFPYTGINGGVGCGAEDSVRNVRAAVNGPATTRFPFIPCRDRSLAILFQELIGSIYKLVKVRLMHNVREGDDKLLS